MTIAVVILYSQCFSVGFMKKIIGYGGLPMFEFLFKHSTTHSVRPSMPAVAVELVIWDSYIWRPLKVEQLTFAILNWLFCFSRFTYFPFLRHCCAESALKQCCKRNTTSKEYRHVVPLGVAVWMPQKSITTHKLLGAGFYMTRHLERNV